MPSKICVYNNKIFLALDTHIVAYSYEKYSKSEDKKFLECFKIKLPVKSVYGSDIRLEVINNHVTGFKSLVIFVFEVDDECNVFIYSSEFSKKLYRTISPEKTLVKYNSDNLFVSDGPTYAFHLNSTLHVYSAPYSINGNLDLRSILYGCENYKILQFKSFGALKSTCRQFLFLVVIESNISDQQRFNIAGYISEKNKPVSDLEIISPQFFFPRCYENILKAVYVLRATPSLKLQSSNVKRIEWDSTACVICTKDEFLIFVDAVLKYCCKLTLPLLVGLRMKVELSSIFLEDANIVLTFENKTVYFITVRNKCEVLKCWTDIEATLVGEIVGKGSKQVLLLKQSDLESWQSDCILYDMSSFVPINILSHSAMPSLKVTLSGLEKKVQVVKSAIRNVEHEVSQKSAATMDALYKLEGRKVNAESVKQTNTFQESLVDLILCKDENKLENIPFASEPCVRLLSEKQRVVNNHWIISLRFMNDGEMSICCPSVKAWMKDQQVACAQKLFVCSSADSFFSGEHGRQILSKAEFFVVLCLDFSVVHISEDVFLILSWYNGTQLEFDNDVFAANDQKVLSQNQIRIKTRIEPSEALQEDSEICRSYNLLFARALQQRVTLALTSLHSDTLGVEVEEWLTRNDTVGANLWVGPASTCVVFDDKSLLGGVHLVFAKSGGSVAEVEAFVRNEKEICLLVNHLYKLLPEDVIISPCKTSKSELSEGKKTAALCLKQEVDTTMASLSLNNIPDEVRKKYAQWMPSQTVGTVTIPKETYQRIRTALVKRECITDTQFKIFS